MTQVIQRFYVKKRYRGKSITNMICTTCKGVCDVARLAVGLMTQPQLDC